LDDSAVLAATKITELGRGARQSWGLWVTSGARQRLVCCLL